MQKTLRKSKSIKNRPTPGRFFVKKKKGKESFFEGRIENGYLHP
jgi:hypothetical protein